jgi:hypothetical protein
MPWGAQNCTICRVYTLGHCGRGALQQQMGRQCSAGPHMVEAMAPVAIQQHLRSAQAWKAFLRQWQVMAAAATLWCLRVLGRSVASKVLLQRIPGCATGCAHARVVAAGTPSAALHLAGQHKAALVTRWSVPLQPNGTHACRQLQLITAQHVS